MPINWIPVGAANGINGFSVFSSEIYRSSNGAPATPTGGTYTFNTGVLVPPAGWSAAIPASVSGNQAYVSSATFSTQTPNIAVGPTAAGWSEPRQISLGSDGERGFVPMAFILTASDPNVFTSAQLTTSFAASPSSASPPIGTGFSPISGDTAAFTFGNITRVATYDAASSTWSNVVGQVIPGNVIATGSITSRAVSTNDVFALRLQSTNANIGNVNSLGFWLDSQTGDTRFAGNVSIGSNANIANNLVVGNNATVGANLRIGNSANIANNLIVGDNARIANLLTVGEDAAIGDWLIVGNNATIGRALFVGNNASIGANLFVGNNAIVSNNAIIGANLSVGTNASIANNLTIGNNAFIGGNLTIAGIITGNVGGATLNANTVNTVQIIDHAVTREYAVVLTTDTIINNITSGFQTVLSLTFPVTLGSSSIYELSLYFDALANVTVPVNSTGAYNPLLVLSTVTFSGAGIPANSFFEGSVTSSYFPYAAPATSIFRFNQVFNDYISLPADIINNITMSGMVTANLVVQGTVTIPGYTFTSNNISMLAGTNFAIREIRK